MEIKATLDKPYTDEERVLFILQYNQDCYGTQNESYEIKETETQLQAWGNTQSELLEKTKQSKLVENDSKGEQARENQNFTITFDNVTLLFDTSRKTQQDIQTAMSFLISGVSGYEWYDNNGTRFVFISTEQLVRVSEIFMQKANIYPKWAYFKSLIDNAQTIEEVNAIVIDYDINLDEV